MDWSQKLRVLLAAHGLSETELGALLRREGLHAAQLDEWRAAAETALEDPSRRREKAVTHPDTTRLVAVERDLRRMEKALAEAAALLVLKKKSRRFGGTRTLPRTRRATDDDLASDRTGSGLRMQRGRRCEQQHGGADSAANERRCHARPPTDRADEPRVQAARIATGGVRGQGYLPVPDRAIDFRPREGRRVGASGQPPAA